MKRNLLLILFVLLTNISLFSGEWINKVETDKARYEPQSKVSFSLLLNKTEQDLKLHIRYYYLDSTVNTAEIPVNNLLNISWQWDAPSVDFKGYLAFISLVKGDSVLEETSIGADVSSVWSKFPRYGFLSSFGSMRPSTVGSNISFLNRFHINGLQFYDWQYKHHKPVPDTPANNWFDIANRATNFITIQRYIDTAHSRNIKAMAYDLVYGAYQDAAIDGVSDEWRMFINTSHQNPDFHDLPSTWASDIYLMDPSNTFWQNYLINQMGKAFSSLPFDGWHGDQLGDRGTRYNYQSNAINVPDGFKNILTNAQNNLHCDIVMNAVNQYGQSSIAQAPVNFLYTEVWEPNTTYDKLGQIILDNDAYAGGYSGSVLAAYLHRGISSTPGQFNIPAVLFADAVTFAFGGCHLELGEHMLSNEYFPLNNLAMTTELIQRLTGYYDFMVAYQNLLRGGGKVITEQLKTKANGINFYPWSRTFAVWNFARSYENKKVFHLINFTNAATLDWRDNQKIQKEPTERTDLPVYLISSQHVSKIWLASPDYKNGIPIELAISRSADTVNFTIPSLKYWDMVVVEFDSITSGLENSSEAIIKKDFYLGQNYPNPFNPSTIISYKVPSSGLVSLKVFNLIGQEVATLVDSFKPKGNYEVQFNAIGLNSGVYFYKLRAGDQFFTKKMLFLK